MGDLSLYQTLGRKIGVMDRRMLRKAAELRSLLNVRAGSVSVSALRLTDTASVVLCLDLAGKQMSQPVDKTEAVRMSGLKKAGYQVALRTLESVLCLQSSVSMRELALQFGCLHVLDTAASVLARYEREQCCDVDSNSSLFQAAALLCVCKKDKVRVDQGRLREVAGVKKSTLDRLIAQMDKIADTLKEEGGQKKNNNNKRKKSLMDDIEKAVNESLSGPTSPKQTKSDKDIEYYKNVDFNEWRRKLLEKAELGADDCKA